MSNEEEKTTVEFGGMSFTGGKAFALITALSTLGGASWGAFEFYKDYMDMKEIIQNIDTTEIENRNQQIQIKMDEIMVQVNQAIDYSRSIKNDLRDDFNRMEKNVDRVEDETRDMEDKVREMIDRANERFDIKRESLQNDSRLQMEALEARLNKKIQTVLDNPLADN
jgi:LPS O-antigen subunit length determinant protein (WzzB/FepE family)